MIRNILLHPDPRLKKPCAPVTDMTDELRSLADDMLATMYDAPGIGLAAPQIGVMHRLIVMDCVKEEGETPRPLVMFNPEVIAASDALNTYEEGCLSIPEQFADVTRPADVDVRWIDIDGNDSNMRSKSSSRKAISRSRSRQAENSSQPSIRRGAPPRPRERRGEAARRRSCRATPALDPCPLQLVSC